MRLALLLACLPLAACDPHAGVNPNADITNLAEVDKEALDKDLANRVAAAEAEEAAAAEAANAIAANMAEATPPPPSARYRCMDGTKMAVRFEGNAAIVSRGGKTIATMQRELAASGILYRGQGHELHGSGDDLSFAAPNLPPIPCTVIR